MDTDDERVQQPSPTEVNLPLPGESTFLDRWGALMTFDGLGVGLATLLCNVSLRLGNALPAASVESTLVQVAVIIVGLLGAAFLAWKLLTLTVSTIRRNQVDRRREAGAIWLLKLIEWNTKRATPSTIGEILGIYRVWLGPDDDEPSS